MDETKAIEDINNIMSRAGIKELSKPIREKRPKGMTFADELQIPDESGENWRLKRLERMELMQEETFNKVVKKRNIKNALFSEFWNGFLENKWKSINKYFEWLEGDRK